MNPRVEPRVSSTCYRGFCVSRRGFSVCGCLVFCSALLLTACQQGLPQPVDITAEDMCRHCKMAISERRYAAEFLSKDGDPYKFDDIGCMVRYLETGQEKKDVVAYFVMDFHSQEWIDAEQAYFVKSSSLKTPMGGNIAAFKYMSGAEEATAAYGGKPLRFADLSGEFRSGDGEVR